MPADPYKTLGLSPGATDREIRAAYRRLVQAYHPDHNNGSVESARKFEEVQEAYARLRTLRSSGTARAEDAQGARRTADPDLETRLADIERELREANAARERARRAAREAAEAARAEAQRSRPDARRASDEELGYVHTDDSFSKILSDARDELFGRVAEARDTPASQRVADLLDELAAKLRGEK